MQPGIIDYIGDEGRGRPNQAAYFLPRLYSSEPPRPSSGKGENPLHQYVLVDSVRLSQITLL